MSPDRSPPLPPEFTFPSARNSSLPAGPLLHPPEVNRPGRPRSSLRRAGPDLNLGGSADRNPAPWVGAACRDEPPFVSPTLWDEESTVAYLVTVGDKVLARRAGEWRSERHAGRSQGGAGLIWSFGWLQIT